MAANDVFQDDVTLSSLVEWKDGQISFGITQPHYHGKPASYEEIETYFQAAGWSRVKDRSNCGHTLFFNYAFGGVLAVDMAPINCYINSGKLLPFDIILCYPDTALSNFLEL